MRLAAAGLGARECGAHRGASSQQGARCSLKPDLDVPSDNVGVAGWPSSPFLTLAPAALATVLRLAHDRSADSIRARTSSQQKGSSGVSLFAIHLNNERSTLPWLALEQMTSIQPAIPFRLR